VTVAAVIDDRTVGSADGHGAGSEGGGRAWDLVGVAGHCNGRSFRKLWCLEYIRLVAGFFEDF